jgi:ferritin-like metal-binding protein YciE
LWAICQAEALHSVRQGQRLERAQAILGQQPDGRVCQQIENLVLGMEEIISENAPGRPRDLALVAAARKIKQFEVAGYCSARDFAQLLGLGAVVELLQQTIDDQTAMDARLGVYSEILATQTGQSEFR